MAFKEDLAAQKAAQRAEDAAATVAISIPPRTSKTAQAEAFLSKRLSYEPVPCKPIQEEGKARGFTPKMIRSAREALSVEVTKGGMKIGWLWNLPREDALSEDGSGK